MTTYILDTSALIAFFSSKGLGWLEETVPAYRDADFFCSALSMAEIATQVHTTYFTCQGRVDVAQDRLRLLLLLLRSQRFPHNGGIVVKQYYPQVWDFNRVTRERMSPQILLFPRDRAEPGLADHQILQAARAFGPDTTVLTRDRQMTNAAHRMDVRVTYLAASK